MNADHVFGPLTDGRTVYEADGPGEEGQWIALDAHVPELVDLDHDNVQVLTKFLREQNNIVDESL